ncbi:MAG: hypothetical protein ABI456_25340 [Ktedonobacteraceae bacterium]|nr:hypothetical protein [Chloroflexota bacterium]
MNDDPLVNSKKAFSVDGSFRDIYVFETDKQDWQKLLTFLHSGAYAFEFAVGNQPMPLPESIETIFAIGIEHSTVVHIDKEHLALNCFFFSEEQIDFDLDPRDFQGDTAGQQISRLLVFLRTIGQLLNKPIVLTPEGGPPPRLFSFDPKTGEEQWFQEYIDVE